MKEETVTVNEHSSTAIVEIKKGNVYVNDKLVAVVKNPRYEDHTIIINYIVPEPTVNVIKENSFTGNKADVGLLGLYTTNDCAGGAMVKDVLRNGPADKAGLERGDIITKYNDNDITNSEQLVVAIYQTNPGDNVAITYKHGGRTETTQAKLADAASITNCVKTESGAACGCRRGHMQEREYGYGRW